MNKKNEYEKSLQEKINLEIKKRKLDKKLLKK